MPSTNPFLDDISSNDKPTNHTLPDYSNGNNGKQNYPTAREEKERLRDRYREEAKINDETPSSDLPPSYDEIAGGRKTRSGYPREKESTSSSGNGNRSSRHRHRHQREGEGEKERSSRHRSSRSGSGSGSGSASATAKAKKKGKGPTPKNVDTIDKMDVTGLFGGSFHHDGPFDACTPHRNKNSKAAPVMAFPADGPNNSIGGASSKKSALDEVFGREELDDEDIYNSKSIKKNLPLIINSNGSSSTLDAIKANTNGLTQFDAKGKSQVVHGPTTMGLGSTTFLDGAPASTTAIKEEIRNHSVQARNGVQRKKSLSSRLQVNGGNNQYRNDNSNVTSPLKLAKTHSGHLENADDIDDQEKDTYVGVRFDGNSKKESTGNKLLRRVKSLKVNRKP